MNDPLSCDDMTLRVDYLYDECDEDDRVRVEAHLASCPACREELRGLRDTRSHLAAWSPPSDGVDLRVVRADELPSPSMRSRIPGWGLAAVAVLVLAAGAAIANVEVDFGRAGSAVAIRTGWQPAPVPSTSVSEEPWRAELAALEGRLRDEMAARQPSVVAIEPPADPALAAADVMRLIRSAVGESEARQQRQLALRMAQLTRELDAQRRSDLVRIGNGLGQLEGTTGAEAARQRELLDYLVRVSRQR